MARKGCPTKKAASTAGKALRNGSSEGGERLAFYRWQECPKVKPKKGAKK
jgi:hypothetical protein